MRNPELTRETILKKASNLFNIQGYKATSLSDICKASGLTKGAIYKNFKDKSELEKESLLYMCNEFLGDISVIVSSAKNTEQKIKGILAYFERYESNPPFKGGCPLMNAAIEVDDSNPKLKLVVKNVMEIMHQNLCKILQNGIKHGEIKEDADILGFSSLIVSSLEGGVMMLKVLDSNKHLSATCRFINTELKRILI